MVAFAAGGFFGFAEASLFGSSLSVVFCSEVGDNSEEIFSELCLGIVCLLHLNHEFRIGFLKDVFDKLQSVATHSVFVGNANFFDITAVHSVQKGTKLGPVVVEATANLGDEFIAGKGPLEIGDLSLEVGFLFVTADSSIADFRFRSRGFWRGEELVNVELTVETLSTWGADTADLGCIGPTLEGTGGYLISLFDFGCRYITSLIHKV